MSQLRLDGVEVPRVPYTGRFRGRERAVLALLERERVVSSSQAGRACHDYRDRPREGDESSMIPGHLCPGYRATFESEGCCKWAPSDGLDVLRRLARRGLCEQHGTGGLWFYVPPGEVAALPPFDPSAWRGCR